MQVRMTQIAGLPFLAPERGAATQSYDRTRTEPYRSLLRTTISGWSCSGSVAPAGKQNTPICHQKNTTPW